jgi:uncharacterized protein (TIGR03437 family)
VYNTAGALGTTEYWGEQTVNVTGTGARSSFTRNMPSATSLTLTNLTTGTALSPASTVMTGARIQADLSVASVAGSASARLVLDRDLAPPYDLDQDCGTSATKITCSFTAGAAGAYSLAYVLTAGGAATDSGAWRQAFVVEDDSPALVELYDATGSQRRHVSPGSLAMLETANVARNVRGCLAPQAPVGPWPYLLGDVFVNIRTPGGTNYPAPIQKICNNNGKESVVFQIPSELAAGTVSIQLTAGLRTATMNDVTLLAASPGLYWYESADGPRALIYHADGTLATVSSPLQRGERARPLAFGLGGCSPAVGTNQSGSLASPVSAALPVIVGLGADGMNLVSATCSATAIGLYDIVFDVSPTAATGPSVGFVVAVSAGQPIYSNSLPTAIR